MGDRLEDGKGKKMLYKAAVIGSGPAAWTALLYLARAQVDCVVFTGHTQGGARGGQLMLTTEIENYPGFPKGIGGPELMELMEKQVRQYKNVTCVEEDVLEIELGSRPFTLRGGRTCVQAYSVIVCTGAYARRLDGVPGDKEFWGKGVSACAVCDGALPIYRNKEIAVIGGGDSACEEALFLTKYAKKVYMILRSDKFRASKIMERRVEEHPKIEIIFEYQVKKIVGNDTVTGVNIAHSKHGVEKNLEVNGVFYGLGHNPSTGFLRNQVEMDEDGFLIRKNCTAMTSVEGVFAAGDVCDKRYKQAITAAGMGCMAALDCERWLSEHKL